MESSPFFIYYSAQTLNYVKILKLFKISIVKPEEILYNIY